MGEPSSPPLFNKQKIFKGLIIHATLIVAVHYLHSRNTIPAYLHDLP